MAAPIQVEATRGGPVEAAHTVDAVALTTAARVADARSRACSTVRAAKGGAAGLFCACSPRASASRSSRGRTAARRPPRGGGAPAAARDRHRRARHRHGGKQPRRDRRCPAHTSQM